jgi:hypothetical protein
MGIVVFRSTIPWARYSARFSSSAAMRNSSSEEREPCNDLWDIRAGDAGNVKLPVGDAREGVRDVREDGSYGLPHASQLMTPVAVRPRGRCHGRRGAQPHLCPLQSPNCTASERTVSCLCRSSRRRGNRPEQRTPGLLCFCVTEATRWHRLTGSGSGVF